jgi:hypothetical protein
MDRDRDQHHNGDSFKEETAAEIAPRLQRNDDNREAENLPYQSITTVQEGTANGMILGIIGLVFSLLSLFSLPFFLSVLGIGSGFFAYRRGARSLGKWAIGLGMISLLASILFTPVLVM